MQYFCDQASVEIKEGAFKSGTPQVWSGAGKVSLNQPVTWQFSSKGVHVGSESGVH